MTTLLIVDDHASFRAWARRMLSEEGFEVVGEAADGASAVAAVARLRPDVTLLDILLPDMTGFEVAAAVRELTTVVLTSSRELSDFGVAARTSGAGFVAKVDLSGAVLERAVSGDGE